MHADHNFGKRILVFLVCLAVQIDIQNNLLKPLDAPQSKVNHICNVMSQKSTLVRVVKRIKEAVSKHGSGLSAQHFPWRLKGPNLAELFNVMGGFFEYLSQGISGPLPGYGEHLDLILGSMMIVCRNFRKLSVLHDKKFLTKDDILQAIVCGSDIIGALNLLEIEIGTNTFVLCKSIPFQMMSDWVKFQLPKMIRTRSNGVEESIEVMLGAGVYSSAQGLEKYNMVAQAKQFLVDRRKSKFWLAMAEQEDAVRWVAEFLFPEHFESAPKNHALREDRARLVLEKKKKDRCCFVVGQAYG
jgi:hypothetical protein